MKVFTGLLLSVLMFIGNVCADEILTRGWQVSDLKDDDDVPILAMALDVEFVRSVFRINGMMLMQGGVAGVIGTGYEGEAPGIYYMYLNVGQHFFLVSLKSDLNGTIDLYTPDGKLYDSGTVTYQGAK